MKLIWHWDSSSDLILTTTDFHYEFVRMISYTQTGSWSRYRQRSLNSMILRYAYPLGAQGLLHRYPATIVEV